MAEAAETISAAAAENVEEPIVFGGERRNMVMGLAMIGAGAGAFLAGLTSTFFAEAVAWVFVAWGLLFLYGDLLLTTRRVEVTEDALHVVIPMRPWNRHKTWEWANIRQLDVSTQRRDTHQDNATLRIHHVYPGDISLDREDREFEPELARLIIERAVLKPVNEAAEIDMTDLPMDRNATYTWKK